MSIKEKLLNIFDSLSILDRKELLIYAEFLQWKKKTTKQIDKIEINDSNISKDIASKLSENIEKNKNGNNNFELPNQEYKDDKEFFIDDDDTLPDLAKELKDKVEQIREKISREENN